MRFDGAIFDLDGTLIDSLADIGNAANEVLASMGYETYTIDRYSTLVGDGVRVLFERALQVQGKGDEAELDECMERFLKFYDVASTVETRPYTGIVELINELKQTNMKLAILSNKPDLFTKRLVDHYFGSTTFSPVFGQRASVPKKPDPAAVFEITSSWGLDNDRVAYIGDTNTDMHTASNAGCFAIGVTWGFRSKEELLRCGANAIVDDADQLREQILSA